MPMSLNGRVHLLERLSRAQGPTNDRGSKAPRSHIPEPVAHFALEARFPAFALIQLAAALAAAATSIVDDSVVEIDPAAVTTSRRESHELRPSGRFKKIEFYSKGKVQTIEQNIFHSSCQVCI